MIRGVLPGHPALARGSAFHHPRSSEQFGDRDQVRPRAATESLLGYLGNVCSRFCLGSCSCLVLVCSVAITLGSGAQREFWHSASRARMIIQSLGVIGPSAYYLH